MGKIIAIANQKGGVGKTTTTINLGYSLSASGKKVLCVDMDPQSNMTSGFGIDNSSLNCTTYNILIEGRNIKEALITLNEMNGISIVPSSIQLAGAEIELVPMLSREFRLKNSLNDVKDDYDYILIDCPPSLGLLTINALTAADSVLVPIQCEYYALEGLTQLMNTINLIKKNINHSLEIEGVVLTMFNARTNLSIQVVDEVKKYFKGKVYGTIIPRNIRLGEAPSFGKPISLYDPHSKGAEAYEELAKEIIERNGEAVE
ncbi:ParA family protein [Thermoanaerobacterium thermosaccharolyticum]|uniref:Sporulation initiation inhibitor protein Soj n=2 Tax=Thermoanaerobacterium thermosaccharolyticum TaxID=1517 RepID=D9TRI4_THETC|nr:ParA family protein [Thermoanaerobacterium thermosaccharolyticum]TCW35260.1 chromosome partitioning protein [Thermohydrogenium kirishiense]ADL70189.1 Cobyrinic acid ac-diamide synthase [Thermoanaerobacterium thermosaccharolyticum DSM 571]AST57430.1 cobyrinic acid a,c-diamide synthase [Thermoanaerobacterium thermosaccharolyticum]KAA5806548.1 ParA family protein [Thermoanaerobacterium thermosaccharolyticum]MBE0069186.1 ParA family protein [Thermoanaerobacterium thermosaccharolyticum]